MSRTKHAADLCVLLVRETYGELTSRIFALLARRGRQAIPALIHHTRLNTREVRHGLAVLLQQNLLYYLTDDSGITFYEANQDAAYYMIRSGRIIDIVKTRYGTAAREVVQNLLLLGHTKVADLMEAYEAKGKSGHGVEDGNIASGLVQNGSNGHSEQHHNAQLDSILAELLDAGFIEPVVKTMFRSPTDTYNIVEKQVMEEHFQGGGPKGVLQKQALQGMVRDGLKEVRSAKESWQNKNGEKRHLNGGHVNGMAKRRKLSNGISAQQDEIARVDRELIVRVNYEKFTVAFRSRQLVKIAAHDIGDITSHVYAEVLRLLEESIPRCQPDPIIDALEVPDKSNAGDSTRTERPPLPSVKTLELAEAISPTIKTNLGIGRVSETKAEVRTHERTESDQDFGGDDPYTEAPAVKSLRATKVTFQDKLPKPLTPEEHISRPMQIQNHLSILAEHSNNLLDRLGDAGLGEWTVDFEYAIAYLKEVELDAYIFQRFGKEGRRISQILRQNGKLDEKQITKFGLIKQKDARTKLVEMQMGGFVDVQEVPKDNNRTPSRTLFLWYFDTERVTAIFLDVLYKAMSRCLQKLEVEKFEHHEVLSLADRSDVRGHEADMLSNSHLEQLEDFRRNENRLLTQIARLDRLVGIFRDF